MRLKLESFKEKNDIHITANLFWFFVRLFIRTIVVLMTCDQAFSSTPNYRFDLGQAIQYAKSHSPQYQKIQIDLESAQVAENTARIKLYPSLDMSLSQTGKGDFTGDNPLPYQQAFDLELSQKIYDNGVTYTQAMIAKIQRQRAELEARKQLDLLTLAIADEFVNYSQASHLADMSRERQIDEEKQFHIIESYFRNGIKPEYDYLRYQSAFEWTRLRLKEQNDLVHKSILKLKTLIGLDEANEQTLATSFDLTHLFEPLAKPAMEAPKYTEAKVQTIETLEAKIADLTNDINNWQIQIARRRSGPEVLLNAGLTSSTARSFGPHDSAPTTTQQGWNAGLVLKYNLLDWGARDNEVKTVSLQARASELESMKQLQDIQLSVQQLNSDSKSAVERLNGLQNLLKTNLRIWSQTHQKYRLGQISVADLTTVNSELYFVKSQFVEAHFGFVKLQYQQKRLQGVLYEDLTKNL